jgi:hypothetical protein
MHRGRVKFAIGNEGTLACDSQPYGRGSGGRNSDCRVKRRGVLVEAPASNVEGPGKEFRVGFLTAGAG